MSRQSISLDDALQRYLRDVSLREHPAQTALREETAGHAHAGMQISPEQGQFMALLIKLIGARRTIEIGVFTGYSALSVALALPEDGRVLACDISDTYTRVGRGYWEAAGVAHKIDLRLAPALVTLEACLALGEASRYDFAFIDADKTGYDDYYENCLLLLRFNWRRPHRLLFAAASLGVIASTVLVKQHYVVDIAGGALVYGVSYAFLRRLEISGVRALDCPAPRVVSP